MFKSLATVFLCFTLFGCSDNNPSKNTPDNTPDNRSVHTPTNNLDSSPSNLSNTSTPSTYTEDVHYTLLEDPITYTSKDIIVTEFFWYGCSHCAKFEPIIQQWNSTKPAGVSLVQSPAVWNNIMALHAKAFFLAQSVEDTEKLHQQLFSVIMRLSKQKDINQHYVVLANVFDAFGVSKEEFDTQLNSFKTKGQLNKTLKHMKQAVLKGTPMLVVNGKYAIINQSVTKPAELLGVIDFLIAKEQAAITETP